VVWIRGKLGNGKVGNGKLGNGKLGNGKFGNHFLMGSVKSATVKPGDGKLCNR